MTPRMLVNASMAVLLAVTVAACGKKDSASYVSSAQAYLAKKEYSAAIIELKNALAAAPDDARTRFLLAKTLLDNNQPAEAELEARKARDLKYSADEVLPVLVWSFVRQGEYKKAIDEGAQKKLEAKHANSELGAAVGTAFLMLGQVPQAREAIAAALADEPGNVDAQVAQVRLAIVDRDLPRALSLAQAATAASPDDVEALMLKSEIQGSLGMYKEAVATVEHVTKVAPNFGPARFALVGALVRARELDRAATELEVLKKAAPNDPRTSYSIALVEFGRGNMAAALENVQKAVQAMPDYLPARYLAGLIQYRRGALPAAEDALRLVLAKVPNDDGTRRILSATYLRRGQPQRAMEMIEPSLRRAPDDPVLLRLAGEASFAMNEPAKAAEYYERANATSSSDVAGRVRLAQVRMAGSDPSRGLHDLEALTATDPGQREPVQALISTYIKRKEFDKALATAKQFVASQPSSAGAYNTLGSVHLAMSNYAAAREAFEKAYELDPNLATAAYNLALLDATERKLDSAKKRYEQVLAKDPKAVTALLGLVDLLILSNAPQAEVDKALRRAVAADPEAVAPRVAMIRYYTALKDWNKAVTAARDADRAIPDTPQILEFKGFVEQASGETNQAIETYRRLAKLTSDNPTALVRVGELQARTKDYTGALATFKAALANAPETSNIWLPLAALYHQSGQTDAGLADARKMEKDKPASYVGYAMEGELLARAGRLPDAAAAFRTSLAKKQVPAVVTRLHLALLGMGKQDEAKALIDKWLKDNPRDSWVRAYLGQEKLNAGDYKAAVPHFRAALDNEPDSVLLLNNLAWSLGETGNKDALTYAERAYRLAPNLPEVVNTYGWVLVQYGDAGDAQRGVALLRKAVLLSPADPEKRLALARGLLKIGDKANAKTELETVARSPSAPARAHAQDLLKTL